MSKAHARRKKPKGNQRGKRPGKSHKHPRERRVWLLSGRDFRSSISDGESLRVQVSRALAWILPYLERTHKILPRLQMPLAVKSYRPSLKRALRTLGSSYYDDGIINLVTHEQIYEVTTSGRRVRSLRRLSRRRILETLAHELAHLHVAEHNFEHAEMTRTIFKTFGLVRECPHCEGSGKVPVDCNPH